MRILTAAFAAAMDFLSFSVGAVADRAKAPEIGARQNADVTSKNLCREASWGAVVPTAFREVHVPRCARRQGKFRQFLSDSVEQSFVRRGKRRNTGALQNAHSLSDKFRLSQRRGVRWSSTAFHAVHLF